MVRFVYKIIVKIPIFFLRFKLFVNRLWIRVNNTQKRKYYLERFDLPSSIKDFGADLNDVIQGDKFQLLASDSIFFVETHNVNEFLRNFVSSEPFVLISHQSDAIVTNRPRLINMVRSEEHANVDFIPDNCVMWFAQNVEVRHPRLESIPIGFPNYKYYSKNFPILVKQSKKKRSIFNVVYLNVNVKNNKQERAQLYEMFDSVDYVTKVKGQFGLDFENYVKDLSSHLFVVSPEGNGIDVHRTFEAIALGCIPIVKRHINNENLRDLPICWVNSFDEVLNIEFLILEYFRIMNGEFSLEKFKFSYWENRIVSVVDGMNKFYF